VEVKAVAAATALPETEQHTGPIRMLLKKQRNKESRKKGLNMHQSVFIQSRLKKIISILVVCEK
jgi:hypothetical protein